MKISKDDVKKYLPHREPFLFVDEVLNINKNSDIHAKKYISDQEYFLKGHFPGNPIFPGVIIIEALGQALVFWDLFQWEKHQKRVQFMFLLA